MPQLANSNKEDALARPSQTPLLPDTAQTILKCITNAMTSSPSSELFQEINQITAEIRIILEKSGNIMQQTTQKPSQPTPQPQLPSQPNPTNPSNTFELLQSMVNNLNINNNPGFSSPDKILTPPIGIQGNQLQSINMLGTANSTLRQSKSKTTHTQESEVVFNFFHVKTM
jgi:hypothetical protein